MEELHSSPTAGHWYPTMPSNVTAVGLEEFKSFKSMSLWFVSSIVVSGGVNVTNSVGDNDGNELGDNEGNADGDAVG